MGDKHTKRLGESLVLGRIRNYMRIGGATVFRAFFALLRRFFRVFQVVTSVSITSFPGVM